MARVKLELPEKIIFSTELSVRISDINYGGHVGNDAVLALAHEARIRFLGHYGFSEKDIAGVGIIMADAVIIYKAEAFLGECLQIDIMVDDISRVGCDIFYRITNKDTGVEIARVKTGSVSFNYTSRQVAPVPEAFRNAISTVPSA